MRRLRMMGRRWLVATGLVVAAAVFNALNLFLDWELRWVSLAAWIVQLAGMIYLAHRAFVMSDPAWWRERADGRGRRSSPTPPAPDHPKVNE